MVDICITYDKSDQPLVSKLSAMLTAEGWEVWWDSRLTDIGIDPRHEMMVELRRARVVIVIWTPASIKSDWVRAEAGRAYADRKLIPVKLPELGYLDRRAARRESSAWCRKRGALQAGAAPN
jgi:hypothetical protein